MKPFASDRQRLPLKALAVPAAADDRVGARLAGHSGGCSKSAAAGSPNVPQVETVKQGDKVVRVIVTCSCGEKIEIDCLYPAGG